MLILFWRPMEGEARWGFQALWQAKVGRPTFEALVSSISKNGPFLSVILVEISSSTHCPRQIPFTLAALPQPQIPPPLAFVRLR